jgi:hypothetical protein
MKVNPSGTCLRVRDTCISCPVLTNVTNESARLMEGSSNLDLIPKELKMGVMGQERIVTSMLEAV